MLSENLMELQEDIEKLKFEIRTDTYSMSIGEWISLYEDEELFFPNFQRPFGWTKAQQTKLIESILLGIPLPPIFVYQHHDGLWTVLDGKQRLFTIFGFAGILRDASDKLELPLILEGTEYLPSLENKVWDDKATLRLAHVSVNISPLTTLQRLAIKRFSLTTIILLKGSKLEATFEIMSRLNTHGPLMKKAELLELLTQIDLA